jgi:pimeloyl-ACP methyl ester carboxylesterase
MFIDVNGITLGYDDVGSGAPLVLLHAFPLHRAMWAQTSAALGREYRVITPDLRGFGESSGSERVTIGELADDVIGLLDALGIERASVGGLSMGGYVALNLVIRYPERVDGLILADTRAGADDEAGRGNRAALAEKALTQGAVAVAEQMLPKLLSAAAPQADPQLVAQVRALIEGAVPAAIAAASLAMGERADSTGRLAAITAPTLVIVGSEDSITPVAESTAMKDAIPQASLAIIPDAGHLSNLERPAAFNRALEIFLERLDG